MRIVLKEDDGTVIDSYEGVYYSDLDSEYWCADIIKWLRRLRTPERIKDDAHTQSP